ncbi:ComEC/Rec2 family competence protein [Larkinella bovis]|uniref:ComEC/Rec2 family competence protein n=1 Tax=Larkinella bovis TaxID=683041 RepID=A0ABW0IBN5_9BACT
MLNTAQDVIIPKLPGIFRTIFLYTGQGESTLMVIPTGPQTSDYQFILVDSDWDKEPGEVDLVALFKDLFVDGGQIDVFINTHPHDDHVGGIRGIYDEIGITEVWHSNHKPAGKHQDAYAELRYVLGKVGKANEYHLKGTDDINKIRRTDDTEVIKPLGLIDYVVLSPSEYLCDDIAEEEGDARNRRIHEQCGVIKFSYGRNPKHILITGDSDKTAWQDHITTYHFNKLPTNILSASHHGSYTFFKDSREDEEVYDAHLKQMQPAYLIVSAPKQTDSPHKHPDDEAMAIYRQHIDEEGIFHLGDYKGGQKICVIVDITDDGTMDIQVDKRLVEAYGTDDTDKNPPKEESLRDRMASVAYVGSHGTRIDRQPMGSGYVVV